MHSMLLVLVLSAAPHDDLLDAADTFERALTLVGRQQRSCQDVLAQNLRQSIRDVRAAAGKRGTTSESVQGLRLFAAGMVLASGLSTCPSQVTELVSEGVADLNRAFDGFASRETLEVERPARRRARDFDDEDDARPARLRRGASLGRVRVVMDSPSPIDGSPSVLLELSQVVFDAPGSAAFGVICRSANGRARTDWSTTEAVSVAAGVLEAPASFSLRYSTLARADVSQGRFVCHVAVFEGRSSTELTSVEVDVELPLRRARSQTRRDCGAGLDDPGCLMERDGQRPMDSVEFTGLLTTLRSTSSDLSKEAQATKAMRRSLVTAAQLGLVMDQFSSDLSRLAVVRALVGNVVNPRHALGHSVKFSSALSREEYVELLSQP